MASNQAYNVDVELALTPENIDPAETLRVAFDQCAIEYLAIPTEES